jgi:FlaG/FlaF family flagellin (archaellin)
MKVVRAFESIGSSGSTAVLAIAVVAAAFVASSIVPWGHKEGADSRDAKPAAQPTQGSVEIACFQPSGSIEVAFESGTLVVSSSATEGFQVVIEGCGESSMKIEGVSGQDMFLLRVSFAQGSDIESATETSVSGAKKSSCDSVNPAPLYAVGGSESVSVSKTVRMVFDVSSFAGVDTESEGKQEAPSRTGLDREESPSMAPVRAATSEKLCASKNSDALNRPYTE